MKIIKYLLATFLVLSFTITHAQIKNATTETVKIYGNCGMCETKIEKAGNVKKVTKVDWDKNTQTATLTYNAKKTTQDEILKRIALSGYDSDKFLAPDDVYANLHGCCQYERPKKIAATAAEPMETEQVVTTETDHADMKMSDHQEMPEMTSTKATEMVKTETEKIVTTETDHADMKMSDHQNMPETTPAKKAEVVKKEPKKVVTTETVPAPTVAPLKPVFDQYFAVKDALVKTDAKTAAAKAKSLLASINAVKMDKLSTEEHLVWMKVMKALTADAKHIAETADVETQRSNFIPLSKNMHDLIKASKTESPVYYQFCPMANDGKGANWLSKESTVKNPYYGSQMLSCGKVVETIK